MGHSIAVMNTKGGVGKSTVVMALAETLSAFHRKNVLVIDSDSQTSISTMLIKATTTAASAIAPTRDTSVTTRFSERRGA